MMMVIPTTRVSCNLVHKEEEMDTVSIASRFVEVALRHNWDEVGKLPDNEVQVLFETVVAAGFEPKSIVPGKIVGGHIRGTDRTYPINKFSPFKVVGQGGNDHHFATGWLDCALRRVLLDTEQLVTAIQFEIERSVPLKAIRLTLEGDFLCECPPSLRSFSIFNYFVDHTQDESKLDACVGIHMYCDGQMKRGGMTATHDVIVCMGCYLRIPLPREVETYGELRQFLTPQ